MFKDSLARECTRRVREATVMVGCLDQKPLVNKHIASDPIS